MDDGSEATHRQEERVARCFSSNGRLQRWPARRADQIVVLWIVWAQLPANGHRSEAEITATLRTWHDLGDPLTLRRQLVDLDLLRRTPDGAIYTRVARTDIPDAAARLSDRFDACGTL